MKPAFNVRQQSQVYIGSAAELLPELLPEGRVVVVSDATIDRLYHPLLTRYDAVLIGTGESIKTLQTVETIYRRFIELGVDRATFVLAVGGGIVSDVAGFAASTYMRGLRFGFVSTTLLGQVDASVGGKNGVNVDGYKNMAGTFTQPQFVVCDPALLRSLPDREFRAGLAEVVKAAIIADADLFARIEQVSFETLRADTDLLADVISAAIRVKADIVEYDEKETGERRKLNLGHTLAHAIEKSSNRMNHGEAVAVGTALIAGAAVKLGVLKDEDRRRIEALLVRLGFDLTPPVEMKRLLKEVGKDKKNEDGMLRIVLPVGIGDCEVRKISPEAFAALFI
ncbi:MAG TPA: 3-dehydroquinate synthase [Candidatus Alistipes intestinigallinarum]|uniref:3-dehydroquinate synthase n=1 Tax=Candidatus Alistipes intestinigallinarum TaxID=2838440 RepID=A0A9D1Z277_9BACT|nr:3-dehydroquinate synthase [Candidatus Alistipes intestinigallinarum]